MQTAVLKRSTLAGLLALAAGAAFAAPVAYEMDPDHTGVAVRWNHLGFSNPIIHFGEVDGRIVYDPENVSASSVEVVLPLSGLNSHVAEFDAHLRSDDFFDAARYPQATFKSTAVEAAGEGRLRVAGDLTIKDNTRPVVLDVTLNKVGPHPMTKRPTIGFDATATLKRSDFGLDLHAPNVGDEMELHITTEASAPAAK